MPCSKNRKSTLYSPINSLNINHKRPILFIINGDYAVIKCRYMHQQILTKPMLMPTSILWNGAISRRP
ncbi:hypothetical protein LPB140_04685 [Sphingorhabdus lutea]|uniref:Uncharacterized protein n=1 Tax=Sphingorhabdus lutea TaxID=1913578 RepID=A0A1L3JAQ5_9SPHN|nr:hypothetical protein LPB140_04685 [Sphingorhabdus lutea]